MTKNPKQVLGGIKAAFTKKIEEADRYIGETRDYSEKDAAVINSMIAGLEAHITRSENKFYNELTEQFEPADFTEAEEEFNKHIDKAKKCILSMRDYFENQQEKKVPTGSFEAPQGNSNANTKFTISDTLRPTVLSRSWNLEEFQDWNEKVKAWFGDNQRTLEKKGRVFQRQLLATILDSRTLDDLRTDEEVTDETPILEEGGILTKIKALFLKEFPLHIRRYKYLKCIQEPEQPFDEWWVIKKKLARNCELDQVKPEDMTLLGLLTGVRDAKLKEEFLRVENPTTAALVKIAENIQSAERHTKTLEGSLVDVKKTSMHKKGKKEAWEKRKAEQESHQGKNDKKPPNQKSHCRNCGKTPACKDRRSCRAFEKKCLKCEKMGHFQSVCRSGKKDNTPEVKSNKVQVKKVLPRGCSLDDNVPVPKAKMVITPQGAKPFEFFVFPDQGATQSLISYDVAKKYGLKIDSNKKKEIGDAQGGRMNCSGSTTFDIKFEGNETSVEALVTKSMHNECLLGWKALQRLRIIHENFPHVLESSCGKNSSVKAVSSQEDPAKAITLQEDDPAKAIKSLMEEEEFKEVFDTSGELKPMKGGQMTIHLKDGPIEPLHIYVPRRVPYAYMEDVKKTLEEDVALGVLEKVEGPSEWCSPMTFTRKKNNKIRKLLDVVKLNDNVRRAAHPFPSPKEIVSTIPPEARLFAVFDCLHGYWQIELDEKSRPLTTFLTQFGRFRYRRAPMGLVSSGDEFCRRTDEALSDLPGVKKLVDDILIFGKDPGEIISRIRNVFQRCKEWGITLARDKYQFGNTVQFAGYTISDKGVAPDPEKLAAIKNFAPPKNLTDLRSWFGITNGFDEFAPDLKMAMLPLKGLLSVKNAFIWTEEHQKSMDLTKEIITNPNGPIHSHFDPSLPVSLYTDASRKGIGFILTQRSTDGALKLITCSSRFLSNAEGNYAVVELELLAIQWAVEKCRMYLAGTHFTVLTDHKPLLGIMNGKNLDAMNNNRIQRLMSKLLGYSYDVLWIPGKRQTIADALSRSPVFAAEEEENPEVTIRSIICEEELPDLALCELSKNATEDITYQEVKNALEGRKLLKDLPTDHPAHHFANQWDFMKVDPTYGVILFHDRIIVPKSSRRKILDILHIQHTGIIKTYDTARNLYFWHGMKNDIKARISSCEECIRLLPSQPLETKIPTFADRPFQAISLDLGKQGGKQHLILADRYSGWTMAEPLKRLDTKVVTGLLEDWFIDYGKPERIRTDGGPQFRSEFDTWCKRMGIIHELSSAYHHESNGHAEVAVRDMKRLLEKTSSWREFREALREYRNSQRYDGLSPAQWLFGRRQRTHAPAMPQAYNRLSNEEINQYDSRRREEVEKKQIDRRSLQPLSVGQAVHIQNNKTLRWDSEGTIVGIRKKSRSYYVNIDGRRKLRNRIFLRPIEVTKTEVNQPTGCLIKDNVVNTEGEVPTECFKKTSQVNQPRRRSNRLKREKFY